MKNNKGFSIVIALFITVGMILTGYFILSFIVPFGKNTKGIEESTSAYYEARKGLELARLDISENGAFSEGSKDLVDGKLVDNKYEIKSRTNVIPVPGEGNSDFNSNKLYNKITLTEPIEISFTDSDVDLARSRIYFRVPDLNEDGSFESLKDPNENYLTWSISGKNSSGDSTILFPDSSLITLVNVNSFVGTDLDLPGLLTTGTSCSSVNFFEGGCGGEGIDNSEEVKIKFSLIKKMKTGDVSEREIPYLEYRIVLNNSSGNGDNIAIPNRYAKVKVEGYSKGFRKDFEVNIPQETGNQAFDFTIFQ